jgi:hypothetical protein
MGTSLLKSAALLGFLSAAIPPATCAGAVGAAAQGAAIPATPYGLSAADQSLLMNFASPTAAGSAGVMTAEQMQANARSDTGTVPAAPAVSQPVVNNAGSLAETAQPGTLR